MSRLAPVDEAEWLAFRFPERRRKIVAVAPDMPDVEDWDGFHFPLRQTDFPGDGSDGGGGNVKGGDAGGSTEGGGDGGEGGGEASGDGGRQGGTGSDGGRGLHPPTAAMDATPYPAEWFFDHSGARLVNWRLQRSLPLSELASAERVRRLIEADGNRGRCGDLWAALREASMAILDRPLDDVLEAGGTIPWGAAPPRRRAMRRP